MLKVPPKLLVIKNGQKSSDLFETLTQNSFRSYDLNEPKKSGLFRFFDGEKAKKHFSRKVSKVTNKNAPRKKKIIHAIDTCRCFQILTLHFCHFLSSAIHSFMNRTILVVGNWLLEIQDTISTLRN